MEADPSYAAITTSAYFAQPMQEGAPNPQVLLQPGPTVPWAQVIIVGGTVLGFVLLTLKA